MRADVDWHAGSWTIDNTLYHYTADRHWMNAEGYAYCTQVVDVCTQVGDIQRYYGYFFVFHDQKLTGDRLTARTEQAIGSMKNRFLVGAEATSLDFTRTRASVATCRRRLATRWIGMTRCRACMASSSYAA
jgi:hypothetical protein